MLIKQKEKQENRFGKLRHLLIFNMCESIDKDYITFTLGFISSIVINDFYNIFNCRINDDAVNFYFMITNCIIFTFFTILLLWFSVEFSKAQDKLSAFKTKDARSDYFQEKMLDYESNKLWLILCWIMFLFLSVVLLNIIRFICINFYQNTASIA